MTNTTTSCGIDDRMCLDNFQGLYQVGERVPGFYQPGHPSSIILRQSPSYTWNPDYIAGMVIFSLVLVCAAMVLFLQLWKMYRRRGRASLEVEMQPPPYETAY